MKVPIKDVFQVCKEEWGILILPVGATIVTAVVLCLMFAGKANGHPPEECPKVEKTVHIRSHFLSVPKITVLDKKSTIKAFQKENGLKEDGIIGPQTKEKCFEQCFGKNKGGVR